MIPWITLKEKQIELYKAEREVEKQINDSLNPYGLKEDKDYEIWIDEDKVDLVFQKKIDKETLKQIFYGLDFDSDLDTFITDNSSTTKVVFTKYLNPGTIEVEIELTPIEQLTGQITKCLDNLKETEKIIKSIFSYFYDEIYYAGSSYIEENKLEVIIGTPEAKLKDKETYKKIEKIGFKHTGGHTGEQEWFTYQIGD